MNYFEAHKLLNEVKDGIDHPAELIRYALFLTGDLEYGVRSEALHSDVQRHQSYQRTRGSVWMVGKHNLQH